MKARVGGGGEAGQSGGSRCQPAGEAEMARKVAGKQEGGVVELHMGADKPEKRRGGPSTEVNSAPRRRTAGAPRQPCFAKIEWVQR